MRASPAVSHHDPAPDAVAMGAGLVACVVCLGGVWACSLQTGAASPGAAGLGHAAVSRAGGPSFVRAPSLTRAATRMPVIAERVSQRDPLPHNLPRGLSSACCCPL